MFSSFRKLLRRGDGEELGIVQTNLDGLSKEDQQTALRMITANADAPVHQGGAEHGYSLAKVRNTAQCPRCHAPTERRYAEFIYATQKGTRIMAAPAGYFCTDCPTVIVDEDLLRQGVSRGFTYQSVIGVETTDDDKAGPFCTWNGKEMIIFFDEVENTMELIPADMIRPLPERPPAQSRQKALKAERRRKLARAARKRNRK